MDTFGKQGGGGRRTNSREVAPLMVLLTSLSKSYSAVLVDISLTGARLQGPDLPRVDEDLALAIETVRTFGTVRWCHDNELGIEFETPISKAEVLSLQWEARRNRRFSPEERAAYEAWKLGKA